MHLYIFLWYNDAVISFYTLYAFILFNLPTYLNYIYYSLIQAMTANLSYNEFIHGQQQLLL